MIAQWHGLKVSAGEITRLKPGDVLMLDPDCAAQVQLRLGKDAQIPRTPRHLRRKVGRAELTGAFTT